MTGSGAGTRGIHASRDAGLILTRLFTLVCSVPADDQVTSLTGVGGSARNEPHRVCGKCGAKISGEKSQEVCPACLLQAGFGSIADESAAEVAHSGRDEGQLSNKSRPKLQKCQNVAATRDAGGILNDSRRRF